MPRRPPLHETPTRDIGPYRLAHRIAVGGMAEVYRALWPQAAGGDRAVVIKRLLPSLQKDAEQRAMFRREAQLGARIDHPNVVTLLDHGDDGDAPYLVLEYVFGVDLWRLSRWMRRTGRTVRVPLAVWIGRELLAGLAAVHAVRDDEGTLLRVVHRDVSPSNLFLSVHGHVKLGDLGIARSAPRETARRAGSGFRAKGKLGYLPPEQVAGREVDQRGDVFGAGVVLAELLMGRPLFSGGTEIGVLLAIRDGDLSPFRAIVPRLPAGLGDVVLDALARSPEDRTPTASAFAEALAPFVAEPEAALRAELGQLVVGALDDERAKDDRTSLAATVEKDRAGLEARTPPAEPDASEPAADAPVYRVERDGASLGELSLAALVRALTTREVRATDTVRTDGDRPRTLASIPELARHLPASTRTPTVRRRTQMAETSELFDLSTRSILGVLVDAYLAKDDGLLLCERGPVRKEIYLERGVADFVTSNRPEELLGEWLVAHEVIDRAELDLALAAMPRFEGRLGETLVALGLVEPVRLFGHIAAQVRDKLLDLFVWPEGHAALYRGVDRPERAFPLGLDPWELFLEGARRRLDAGLDDARVPADGSAVWQRTAPLELGGGPAGARPVGGAALEAIWTACAAPRALGELEGLVAEPRDARAGVLVLSELGVLARQGGR